ncbi:hypothetical protein PJI17_31070, partial [Mycobacterium kansasii]
YHVQIRSLPGETGRDQTLFSCSHWPQLENIEDPSVYCAPRAFEIFQKLFPLRQDPLGILFENIF